MSLIWERMHEESDKQKSYQEPVGTYEVLAHCKNCGHVGKIREKKGVPVNGPKDCPVCGVRNFVKTV